TAEILSYSRAKGLFAGIDLSGGVLRPDDDANTAAYGRGATPRTILASRGISAPTQASAFLAALGTPPPPTAVPRTGERPEPSVTTPGSSPQARGTPPERRSTIPSTDDDVRAQAITIRQAIDLMLAGQEAAGGGAVGTAGSASSGGGTVVVDRARLMQLRQQ